jgi:hypothetical protein
MLAVTIMMTLYLLRNAFTTILCVVFAQLIANIGLTDQFSLSCYLKARGYQESELFNPLLFPIHSCNIWDNTVRVMKEHLFLTDIK